MITKQKILIIGGCGYIGSNLYLYLKKQKYKVDTVDLEWFGNYVNPSNIKKDYRILSTGFLGNYQVIILLAGHSSVAMCQNKALEAFKNNVANFIGLLEKLGNQIFIYASSSSVYGNTGKRKISEDYNNYLPQNYYDLTKKEIDLYAHLSKVKYYGLRLGTVNGFSPNLRLDLMINKMYKTGREKGYIQIMNSNLYRPVLGITDLCRSIEHIIKYPAPKGVYNLASFNLSIGEMGKRVARYLGNVKIIDKGNTPSYNFSIATQKFERTFKYHFQDTIESIIDSLRNSWDLAHKSVRI